METQAANTREKYGDDNDDCSDRLSQLPESILLHILCFLSDKKAAQTCLLSKSWRNLGPTRPVIDLRVTCDMNSHVRGIGGVCENCFMGNNKAFLPVLEKTFQRYHHHNLFPHELHLHMFDVIDSQSISVLRKWIPIFINPDNRSLTTFRLSFSYDWGPYFNLPSVIFQVESLLDLHLDCCRLYRINFDNVRFKNLQYLTLSTVSISDEALEKVISGCLLIKRLVLKDCRGFRTINIGNRNHCLNFFEISCSYENRIHQSQTTSIEIKAPTLESIRIECPSNWHPNNSKNNFPHLKFLLLSHVTLSTNSFHYFSFNFPRLQELSLLYCSGFEEINLSSCSISRLIINHTCCSVKNVAIDVPNILYFEFSTIDLTTSLSLTTTSTEWKSHLNLFRCKYGYKNDVLPRIENLIEMVRALSQSQISLTLSESLYLEINQTGWDFNDHPLVVEHLGLNINEPNPDSFTHYLNALFRIFRPRYTKVVPDCKYFDNEEKVIEFLWKTLVHDREKTEYGWEQHLEEVSIKYFDNIGGVWHHVEWKYLKKISMNQKMWKRLKKISINQKMRFRFRLKWKD